jgi:uncharacterized protein with PIN domain
MESLLHTAQFRFEGRLAGLLRRAGEGSLLYSFHGTPSLKDAIEALGVPHVEAGTLFLNDKEVGSDTLLHHGDSVVVQADTSPLPHSRFVLDVHLGSLARALRLLGFDCAYRNDYSDPQIVDIADTEGRAVLTRDIGLLKHKRIRYGYWLRSQNTEEQAREVLQRYKLQQEIRPFLRCLLCNAFILPVAEAVVREKVPPRVLGFRQEYFQCSGCGKVYWKGTHYDRMLAFIDRVSK